MKQKIALFFFILQANLVSGQLPCIDGMWVITGSLIFDNVMEAGYTLNKEDTMVDTIVVYTDKDIYVGKQHYKIMYAIHDTIDNMWLWKDAGTAFRPLALKDFGITANKIKIIDYTVKEEIEDSEIYYESSGGLGTFLYVIDDDTLVTLWNDYYLLKRKK